MAHCDAIGKQGGGMAGGTAATVFGDGVRPGRNSVYRRILEETPVGIAVAQDGFLRFVNPAAESLFGLAARELESRPLLDLVDVEERPRLLDIHRQWLRNGFLPDFCDLRPAALVDAPRYWRVGLNGVDWRGRPAVLAAISDMTEQVRAREEMRRVALHDSLTGLPNRILLADRINRAIAGSRRSGKGFALIFLDLDGFKPINDRAGHTAGDGVLREIAARLRRCVRETDTVARVGGDEFVVLVQDVQSRCETLPVARKLIDAVNGPVELADGPARLGASAGMSFYPEDGVEIDALMRMADESMYLAKRSGKNHVRCVACPGSLRLDGSACN
ncbi:MAG: GGDEF domain-containing protein [Rhodocyclaceae bacterium]|nr:GGDEF domain-containing protein [Rhodocyclaceae bacterium]